MLGPVLERLNDELLDPLIDRTFAAMLRGGLIPPPPRELEGVVYKVGMSRFSRRRRRWSLGAIDGLAMLRGTVAQITQQPVDKVDWDQAIDEYGQALGVSPRVIVLTTRWPSPRRTRNSSRRSGGDDGAANGASGVT